jgi:SAM-dependent methyltransferase/GNAT superfamily N-acetyltransferase
MKVHNITIKQATETEIPTLESILLDTVNWLREMGQPLWDEAEITWAALSKNYKIGDFYIAFLGDEPAGCMALVDYDPFFWPDIKKGDSLFIHKLAVTKTARKAGVSDSLMGFFKSQGSERGVKTLRLDTDALRLKTRAFYERHGFTLDKTKIMGKFHVAFYVYALSDSVLAQNKSSWNAIADDFFGVTALPIYGCLCPTEDELQLFPDLNGKKILDIGCGSGHSLKWCGEHGANELWGLDMSDRQLENANRVLIDSGYAAKLFCSPMERDPGLPQGYFDVAYSIYAIGWAVDLEGTLKLISSYLKPGGVFIFSWDHPFLHCVDVDGERLVLSGSYYEPEPFTFHKGENRQQVRRDKKCGSYTIPDGGVPLTLYNRRLSDYVNALAAAGFAVERVVEETDKDTLTRDAEISSAYYAPCKAKRFPLSIIFKARKL